MEQKKYLLTLCCLLLAIAAWAQPGAGEINGVLRDEATGKPLDFANIVLELNGIVKGGVATDEQGRFSFKALAPGNYTIKATSLGFNNLVQGNNKVSANQITFVNLTLKPMKNGVQLPETVYKYTPPQVIKKDDNSRDFEFDDFITAPNTDPTYLANLLPGVVSRNGSTPTFNASRPSGTRFIVNGTNSLGAPNIPSVALNQVSVITRGVAAQYGDYVGGAISYTTKAPSAKTEGVFQVSSSSLFDPYHFNEVQGFVSGPLLTINKGDLAEKRTILGYALGASVKYEKDRNPSAIGIWQVKDDKLEELQNQPLQQAPIGTGFVPMGEYITQADLEKVKVKQNADGYEIGLTGEVVYQVNKLSELSVGGQAGVINQRLFSFSNSLFNADNNPQRIRQNYQAYLQFTQRFEIPEKEAGNNRSVLQSAYYRIRADYSTLNVVVQDANHQDRFFDYGYIGKFQTYQAPNYNYYDAGINGEPRAFVVDGDTVRLARFWEQTGFADTLYTFERSELNPIRANYTSNYFDQTGAENVNNFNEVRTGLGLINGDVPTNIYSQMWAAPGALQANYSKAKIDQYTLNALGELSFSRNDKVSGRHDLQFGLQFEQQVQRSYAITAAGGSASGLWGLARQLTNSHIQELDRANPILVFDPSGAVFQDTVKYNRLINREQQSNFDSRLRDRLMANGAVDAQGNPITETSFIDVNAYGPEFYSLNMFTPDELLNNGNSLVSYYGYDHLGNRVRGQHSYDKFLNDPARIIGAFQPVYTAAWIQDKFTFKEDLIVRLGLRVERYDANQKVLRDPFSLYPIRTAGQVRNEGKVGAVNLGEQAIPSVIEDHYVVYVDDVENPTSLVGYRNPETQVFYNADGIAVNDPAILANATGNGRVAPYLIDANNQQLTVNGSFRDYEPQINLLPRVMVSFPISSTARFFTTYDVLTQRPPEGAIARIDDYFFLQNRSNRVINNPNLKPVRRTDYELGFKQAIGKYTGVSIRAFYTERRNEIQQFRFNHAYPVSYTTFGNLDFATVKGFTLEYEFLGIGNLQLNANYTMQFADGTGSNSASSQALIAAGQPNLRTLAPLNDDFRHIVKGRMDYRFKADTSYNGPIVNLFGKERRLLAGSGLTLVFNASSGSPYTQQSIATPEAQSGIASRSPITGGINAARLPWQFYMDITVDRAFPIKLGTTSEDKPRFGALVTFVSITNLLNNQNVVGVYRFSGSVDDDGYLNSPQGQQAIAEATSAQSFVDLYNVKMANPGFYALPRLAKLGVRLSF